MVARYRRTRAYPASLRSTVDSLRAVMTGREAWLQTPPICSTGQARSMPWATRPMPRWCIRPHSCCEKDPVAGRRSRHGRLAPHGGVCVALPGHRALLFTGSASDAEVVATIARRGRTIVVGPPIDGAVVVIDIPDLDGPFARAVVATVVAELLALELWVRTDAQEIGR